MDAFYASVEQRDNPDLQGKPIAVGWDSPRGVVATASYEARKFGVRSAMPVSTALKLCANLILVKPRMEVYKEVSLSVRSILEEYTDLIEPLSLDEAYLDVTENKKRITTATQIAKEIRAKISEKTQLTASAGVSSSKFLAKIASDLNKPDGLTVIPPKKAREFILKLDIRKFHGIGKKTAEKMIEMGIINGSGIVNFGEKKMITHFGKNGKFFFDMAVGKDERPVVAERPRKSVSVENTFEEDLHKKEDVEYELSKLAYQLEQRISRTQFQSKTLTLKVKYSDFKIISRAKTSSDLVENHHQIMTIVKELITLIDLNEGVRLLGLGVSISGTGRLNKEDDSDRQLTMKF